MISFRLFSQRSRLVRYSTLCVLALVFCLIIGYSNAVVEAVPEATSISVGTINWGSASSGTVDILITTDDNITTTSFEIDFDPTVVTFVQGVPGTSSFGFPGTGLCNLSEGDGINPDTISCNGVWIIGDMNGTDRVLYTLRFSRLEIDKQSSLSGDDITYSIDVTNKSGTDTVLDWVDANSTVGNPSSIGYSAADGAINSATPTDFDVNTIDVFPDGISQIDCGAASVTGNELNDTANIAAGSTETYACTGVIDLLEVSKTPDVQTINEGEDAEFDITITNTGPISLTNVIATDPPVAGCNSSANGGPFELGPTGSVSATVTYTCTAIAVTDSFINTVMVTGDPDGDLENVATAQVIGDSNSNLCDLSQAPDFQPACIVAETSPGQQSAQDTAEVSVQVAVELASFGAESQSGSDVLLTWATAAEIDNAGFNVYRIHEPSFDFDNSVQINSSLIASQAMLGQGADYSLMDSNIPNGVWYYFLEDVDIHGESTLHGPVMVDLSVPTSAALSGFVGSGPAEVPVWMPLFIASLLAGVAMWARRQQT